MSSFSQWLAQILNKSDVEIQMLLRNETAFQFLISWSIFESKCFTGYMQIKSIEGFAKRIISESFLEENIEAPFSHFHQRYQDDRKLLNLLHGEKTSKAVTQSFKRCLSIPKSEVSPTDKVFFVACVVYRYRNNMFHGSKGVQSWLSFENQIRLCTSAMQTFLLHAEAISPSMSFNEAA